MLENRKDWTISSQVAIIAKGSETIENARKGEVSRVGSKDSKREGVMTVGIYAIVNKIDGKRYVGKSVNIEKRWTQHKSLLRLQDRKRDVNRVLFNAVKKHGLENFCLEYLEELIDDDNLLKDRELHWISYYQTTDRKFGYNLRLDSSTKCLVHDETKKLISSLNKGDKNPNFGKHWTQEMKDRASEIALSNHVNGKYSSPETKKKYSEASIKYWKDNEDKKEEIFLKLAKMRRKFNIEQYTKNGTYITTYETMMELLLSNPHMKRQCIYACAYGQKKSYLGYVWKLVPKI